jgi:hypothetical protein
MVLLPVSCPEQTALALTRNIGRKHCCLAPTSPIIVKFQIEN